MTNQVSVPENRVIHHEEFKKIKKDIRNKMELSIQAGEPMCVALEGCTGAGKTTLVKALMRDLQNEAKPPIKIFYMMTPADVTVKGMISKMLYRLGDPHFDRGRQTTLDARLQEFLRNQGYKLVILDDIQHMIKNNEMVTGGRNESVSEWLKVLIKELNIPFLIVSVEDRIEKLLLKNTQLSRLFVTKHVLKPLSFRTKDEQIEFFRFVSYYLEGLDSKFSTSLVDDELGEAVEKIHILTNGIPNKVTKLLLMAAECARVEGSEGISIRHLAQTSQDRVFETRDEEGALISTNPFIQDLLDSSGK